MNRPIHNSVHIIATKNSFKKEMQKMDIPKFKIKLSSSRLKTLDFLPVAEIE